MQRSERRPGGLAGKIFLCSIGLSLILVGGVFEWLLVRSYQHAQESRAWSEVEAVVLRSEMDERLFAGSPREYRLHLLYGYSFEGEDQTSGQYSPRGAKWTKDESAVESLRDTYPVGSTHAVWVNPDSPSVAILKHDTKAAGYTLWFPALFIMGGLGMIWGVFSNRKIRRIGANFKS